MCLFDTMSVLTPTNASIRSRRFLIADTVTLCAAASSCRDERSLISRRLISPASGASGARAATVACMTARRAFSAVIRASISVKRSAARSWLRLMASPMRVATKSTSVVTSPTARSKLEIAAAWRSCASETEGVSHLPLVISSKAAPSSVLSIEPPAIASEIRIAMVRGDFARTSACSGRITTVLLKSAKRFRQRGVSKPLTLTRVGLAVRLPQRQGRLSAADDEPARCRNDPAAILALDRFDAAKVRRGFPGLDLDDAVAPLDQRDAVDHAAHHVILEKRRLERGGGLAEHHRDRGRRSGG